MLKTHYAGRLRTEEVGSRVTLAGWVHRRRDHGGLIFIDLRDSTGLVQVVVNPQSAPAAHAAASDIRNEFVVQVTGEVAARRAGTENANLPTGSIEVAASEVVISNTAKTPPFYINEDSPVEDTLRLKYRYLDLRRERLHENIILRANATRFIRNFLFDQGFMEIETPVLANPTPEGARDYLVPSRVTPGSFYALPQSPQQFKQILMVAGFEKYFQIAHCFRDEDLRADRQPEHTQIDLEWSFIEQEDILQLMEELYTSLVREFRPDANLVRPFPRLTFDEAIARYGSDKPDIRYGLELADLTDVVRETDFAVFKSVIAEGGQIKGLAVPGGAEFSRKQIDELTAMAQQGGAKGLVSMAFGGEGPLETLTAEDVRSPVARFFSAAQFKAIATATGAGRGDLVLIVAADWETVARQPRQRPPRGGTPSGPGRPEHVRVLLCGRFPAPDLERGDQVVGARHTIRLRRRDTRTFRSWTRTPARRGPSTTTWSATVGSWAAAASASTRAKCRSACWPCSKSVPTKPATASGTCWTLSSTARPRTEASATVSTASVPCSPVSATSARSSPSPRRRAPPTP